MSAEVTVGSKWILRDVTKRSTPAVTVLRVDKPAGADGATRVSFDNGKTYPDNHSGGTSLTRFLEEFEPEARDGMFLPEWRVLFNGVDLGIHRWDWELSALVLRRRVTPEIEPLNEVFDALTGAEGFTIEGSRRPVDIGVSLIRPNFGGRVEQHYRIEHEGTVWVEAIAFERPHVQLEWHRCPGCKQPLKIATPSWRDEPCRLSLPHRHGACAACRVEACIDRKPDPNR